MRLTFLGTRGGIDIRSRQHRRHSALLVGQDDTRVMIDCGGDWLHHLHGLAPTAIVITHAHPDHAAGLADGAPCPVYMTAATSRLLGRLPISDRRTMPLRRPVRIESMRFRAVPVQHSILAPAVGYRVSAEGSSFFYVPDIADFPGASAALRGIDLYIGDGATMRRSMVRRKEGGLIGHAPIADQLDWCARAHVRCAIFTHCGSAVVRSPSADALVAALGADRGVEARIAHDGDCLSLPFAPSESRSARPGAPYP